LSAEEIPAQPHTPTPAALEESLFSVAMQWGQQPVRLTAYRCAELPLDAPITSVHIVAFHGERVLVVRDRKGLFGFPGGRLEAGETREEAMVREVYEEACAHLEPGYTLFGVLKIECTEQLPGRAYPHAFSYMAMYAGMVRALEPVRRDPAGIITGRDLFTPEECDRRLDPHDQILLREALAVLHHHPLATRRLRAFLQFAARRRTEE
jgi:8-oxo-dGTP pyrophosphatase MutT (NUDIX family)